MPYDVEAIRKRLKQSMGGRIKDPDKFKPEKAESPSKPIKYRFFILPPLQKGDVLKSGTVNRTMRQFFIQHGEHWVNNKPTPCPRVWDGSDCPVCQHGFDMIRDEKDQAKRSEIRSLYMPSSYCTVNIYFPPWDGNPEELRGKVKYYDAPKSCFDIWSEALLRDDKGDPEEPQAHGIFFDENAAFLFQLEVLKNGSNNGYKTSKFVTSDGEPVPMVGKRGQPNKKGIETLLTLRHNLWDKVEEPVPGQIQKVYSILVEGDDPEDEQSSTGVAGGFDDDETGQKDKSSKTTTDKSTQNTVVEDSSGTEQGPPTDDVIEGEPIENDEKAEKVTAAAESPDLKVTKQDEEFDESNQNEGGDDDVGSSEIDALLSQLQDDDG